MTILCPLGLARHVQRTFQRGLVAVVANVSTTHAKTVDDVGYGALAGLVIRFLQIYQDAEGKLMNLCYPTGDLANLRHIRTAASRLAIDCPALLDDMDVYIRCVQEGIEVFHEQYVRPQRGIRRRRIAVA